MAIWVTQTAIGGVFWSQRDSKTQRDSILHRESNGVFEAYHVATQSVLVNLVPQLSRKAKEWRGSLIAKRSAGILVWLVDISLSEHSQCCERMKVHGC